MRASDNEQMINYEWPNLFNRWLQSLLVGTQHCIYSNEDSIPQRVSIFT